MPGLATIVATLVTFSLIWKPTAGLNFLSATVDYRNFEIEVPNLFLKIKYSIDRG
jgi:hypothetical protein